ncbi:MAG: PBP1A family penicillin-binding protein [Oligoflexia bacterium]|nr:PBP1A family penicillin-binding protein [Oligoflexia bacterium]
MFKKFLWFCFFCSLMLLIVGGAGLVWGYYYITRDLPKLKNVEDYRPPAVSQVFAADGTLMAEFYEQRRYPARIAEIPVMVRNCFLAAEDASFYSHPGIDPQSILRAIVKNIQSGESAQGGSTITQQVVKNLLLSPEKKIQRKVKEAILSYQIEKRLTKDEILEIYLNQIFFGNSAYGIKAAARLYFHKELADLSLAEGAMLASLPKAPSRYSPLGHMQRAKRRQRYVLDQMVKAGFITQDAADKAFDDKVDVFQASAANIFHSPYYVGEVRRLLTENEAWRNLNIDTDGLRIETALDTKADEFTARGLRVALREADKRRGWRGPIGRIAGADIKAYQEKYGLQVPESLEVDTPYPALVLEVQTAKGLLKVQVGKTNGLVILKDETWTKKRLDASDNVSWVALEQTLKSGDVIEVVRKPAQLDKAGKPIQPTFTDQLFSVDQTPDLEGSALILDPLSGHVVSMIGGYSYQRSVFNRATQGLRQPGSTFKPILYLAAVDGFQYTPATIVYDAPRTFRVGDEFWTPNNFDEKFLGPITLRTALEKSRNLVSADIVSRIGIDAVIQYARKLGITSKLGRNLSLSLGSSEVTLLELSRAYGVFPAKGILVDSVIITRITDRFGREIYNAEADKLSHARRVVNENSAFIMANMMKGVVEHGTGYKVKELGRPVAGKTGTSNDQMDTWFIGYTPNWVCGIWIGFDVKKTIGDKETGGKVAAPAFLYIMRDFLSYEDANNYERLNSEAKAEAERLGVAYVAPEPLQPLDFSVPDGVDPFWINKETGLLAEQGSPGSFLEYFVRGTEPSKTAPEEADTSSYLESPDL